MRTVWGCLGIPGRNLLVQNVGVGISLSWLLYPRTEKTLTGLGVSEGLYLIHVLPAFVSDWGVGPTVVYISLLCSIVSLQRPLPKEGHLKTSMAQVGDSKLVLPGTQLTFLMATH